MLLGLKCIGLAVSMPSKIKLIIAAAMFCSMALVPGWLWGHAGQPSLLHLNIVAGTIQAQARLHALDFRAAVPVLAALSPDSSLEAIGEGRQAMLAYLSQHLMMARGQQPCLGQWRLAGHEGQGMLRFEGQFTCPQTGDLQITSRLFWDVESQHRTVVAVLQQGAQPQTLTLSQLSPSASLRLADANLWITFARFVLDGAIHIGLGVDHVFFVLGLLLICAGFNRALFWAVSGFTLAHTLTLVLAALGRLAVAPAVVEPIIGASIAYLGAEALLQQRRSFIFPIVFVSIHVLVAATCLWGWLKFPWLVAVGLTMFATGYAGWIRSSPGEQAALGRFVLFPFAFGLAHGLGFAGPLLDLTLPTGAFIVALVGFNLGVELGQLLVVALAALLLQQAQRWPIYSQARGRLRIIAAWAFIGVGCLWFFARI